VPVGRGLVATSATACGLAALAWGASWVVPEFLAILRRALGGEVGASPAAAAMEALGTVLRVTLPTAGAAAGGALAAGLLQTGGLFVPDAARPRGRRISPGSGLRRALSGFSVGWALLSLAVALSALGVAWARTRPFLPSIAGAPRLAPWQSGAVVAETIRRVGLPLLVVLAAAAGAEAALVRRRHLGALRMTRAEVERDHREDEGDPRLRAERRRRHGALASGGAPPGLALVVVNPTHLAVALTYPGRGDVPPRVAWMASGTRAAVLRRLARRAGIPVVQDVALARSLFQLGEAGEIIPDELHQAVAAVLARVYPLPEAEEEG
jgi:flagellar biosynthesis protein FlhB